MSNAPSGLRLGETVTIWGVRAVASGLVLLAPSPCVAVFSARFSWRCLPVLLALLALLVARRSVWRGEALCAVGLKRGAGLKTRVV